MERLQIPTTAFIQASLCKYREIEKGVSPDVTAETTVLSVQVNIEGGCYDKKI